MQGCVTEQTAPEALAAEVGEYWRQSGQRPWIADMSHWRGRGRWADDDAWTSIGREHLKMFRQLCLLAEREVPVRSMIEWGPGGGANAIYFAPYVQRMYGVDISPANLQECGRQLHLAGFQEWCPIEIEAAQPERVLGVPEEPVDFALCTAVFQHFPGKEYGHRVLRVLHALLDEDGLALVQTRYDDGSETLKCKKSDYATNVVTFTSYRIEEFWGDCKAAGFEPLAVVLRQEPCYAYYMLKKGEGRD